MRKLAIFMALCLVLIFGLTLQGWASCILPTGAGDYLLTLGEGDSFDETLNITPDKILDLTFALNTSGFT